MPAPAKGKKKGSKKPAKIVPDPDAAYRQQLDETWYMPKAARLRALEAYGAAADSAITANTVDVSSPQRDAQREGPISFIRVPDIFRALGLCLTEDQISQITAMTAQIAAPPSPEDGVAEPADPAQVPSGYADRGKLRALLVELLHTRVLAYDPQVLASPHPKFPERVSSVVYSATEKDIRACFSSIWEATGRKVRVAADGTAVRCIAVDQLEELLASAQADVVGTQTLTRKELQDLYFFVMDAKDDVVKEDAFLHCLIHVQ
ncbi:hypothetical protein NESM_000861200 [Novymonas esmeraldas]|uniref:Uncharacterized protein n=1 Tax=Novymonas esmeraldas TaxID=1808958 RepID=A0AAW0F0L6_9TRYP